MADAKPSVNSRSARPDVLVLAAETRSALAVTRSLGKHGLDVWTASHLSPALASSSCYSRVHIPSPNPSKDGNAYQEWLIEVAGRLRPRMLLPVTDVTVELTLEIQNRLPKSSSLPFIDFDLLRQVNDKGWFLGQAERFGFRCPRSVVIAPARERTTKDQVRIETFQYPACLKPLVSSSRSGSGFVKPRPIYPKNAGEVIDFLAKRDPAENIPYILQEYIDGGGVGFFALCVDGEILCKFCHKRILEKPPSGGVSVLSESIPESEVPVSSMVRDYLRELNWQGVAMFEFKQARDGQFYLLELNPRFWGSLQLAIDCDRDFPSLLFDLFCGQSQSRRENFDRLKSTIEPYRLSERLRWELGTLDHFVIRLKEAPQAALYNLFFENSLRIFSKGKTRGEVLRLDDPKPFATELRQYIFRLFR